MKHILNNLSNEEKNSIREQHTGGMKVMTENFSRLMNAKLGDAKPLVSEEKELEDAKPTPGLDLTPQFLELMKKVYIEYRPLGRDGLRKNNKKDNNVLKIQKYFNETGSLGKNKKYDSLKENGIFDEDTYWQVNNSLSTMRKEWWTQNKY
jgi:hypothetical protein